MKKFTAIFLAIGLIAFVMVPFLSFRLPGGDHFEIKENGKLIMEQMILADRPLKTISLSEGNIVEVMYSHCGQRGTKRTLSLKNKDAVTIHSWSFPDGTHMRFKVRLPANSDKYQQLHYRSAELPGGRHLVNVKAD